MGIRSTLALAVLATLLSSGFVWSCSSSTGSGSAACTPDRIGGRNICLKAGVRCQEGFERRYRSYGLTCHDGRLRERTYIGPPNP